MPPCTAPDLARPADLPREAAAGWEAPGQLGHLIALAGLESVGPARARAAVAALGSPRAVLRARPEALASVPGFTPACVALVMRAGRALDDAAEVAAVRDAGLEALTWADPAYPERLRHIYDPPLLLFRQGPVPAWERVVAVVGTRRSSHYGETQAYRLGRDLAAAGVLVVSGLARGIDAAAHRGAMDAGGRTAAFLGGSQTEFWPPENRPLRDRMLAAGMSILSEYPPGTPPRQWRFPARNRLVAAVAHAVVVVEAPGRSGALITAKHAADYATEVMVMPGPADSDRFAGGHGLLRDGARLVRHADDVLADLGWAHGSPVQLPLPFRPPADLTADEGRVFAALSGAGDRPDELSIRLAMPVSAVMAALCGLQLKECATRRAGPTFFPR
ncbi:MAG: DNA-protecting protein DprA [Candidatus Sericytochromatia bacterium]|nr:DNA-protecting protein DprA [Candidatus Tanganyikabacteria bacterium]